MDRNLKARMIRSQELKAGRIMQQVNEIEKIITSIEAGKYHNASIQIRNNLNASYFEWYKDINSIIDNQISNLFYDIETGKTLTLDFFKGQISELMYDYKNCRERIRKLKKELEEMEA